MPEKKQPRGDAPRTQEDKIRLAHNIITSVLTASGATGTMTGQPEATAMPYRYSFYNPMGGPTGERPVQPGPWATAPWPNPPMPPQPYLPVAPPPSLMYGAPIPSPPMPWLMPNVPWPPRRPF